MKVRNVLFYISLLAAVVSLTNCGNPFDDAPASKAPGTGLVSIHISGGNAGQRSLLPQAAPFSRYTLNFISEGKEPVAISSTDSAVNVELESGSWEVIVEGYVTIEGAFYPAARGTKTITVAVGQSSNESIAITADTAGEEGKLSYDIRLSIDTETLSKALLILESLNGEYKTEINLKENGAEKGTLIIKPGFYLLTVQLENNYQAAGKTEVVHIYTNMETKAEYTFTSGDFTRVIPISGAAAIAGESGKAYLFVYGDAKYEDLISRTEVDLSGGTWKTVIPAVYGRVYFRLSVEDEGGETVFRAAGYEDIPESGKTGIVLPKVQMTAFSISAAEAGLIENLTGDIDEDESTITLASQAWIENLSGLKAQFESTGTVTVNGAAQESGVTIQDFRRDIVYRVTTEANVTKDYTVVFESPQTTGLPVIKIDTENSRPITSKEEYIKTNIIIVDPNNPAYNVELTGYENEIRGRGNTTWGMPKKPYTLKLKTKTPLLGMPTHKRWHLLANYADKTLLRTEAAFKLGEILEDGLGWTSRSRHIQLYLNNEYQGAYQLVEAIKIDENRVNIKEITKKNPQRGYILEVDVRKGEAFNFTTTKGVVFNCSDPDDELDETITGETITLFEKIQADVQNVEDVLYSDNFADPDEGYRKYLDADSFIDWYLVNEITKNNDAVFFSSVYMYYDDEKKKYCMGPVWDFDISLGNINYNDNDDPQGFWIKGSTWINRLFEDASFVSQVKTRWNMKRADFSALQQYIDERASYINAAQRENFKRWDILNISVWPNVVVTGSYQGEIAYLKTWLANRLAWLDTAISDL
jgi:spore coat protein CotH